jgi:hypothetical protein
MKKSVIFLIFGFMGSLLGIYLECITIVTIGVVIQLYSIIVKLRENDMGSKRKTIEDKL